MKPFSGSLLRLGQFSAALRAWLAWRSARPAPLPFLPACLLVSACALQTWTTPQPYFSTKQPADAWARVVAATEKHCGGVITTNEESGIAVAPWIAWNTGEGLYLTQCLVTLLRGDEHVRDVRVTFAARKCPLSSMDNLEALARTCEVAETIPDQVKNGLEITGQRMEADVKR